MGQQVSYYVTCLFKTRISISYQFICVYMLLFKCLESVRFFSCFLNKCCMFTKNAFI